MRACRLAWVAFSFACGVGPTDRVPDASNDARPDAPPAVDGGEDAPADCPTPDADGDGEPSYRCGGRDCDDTDPAVHPGAPDDDGWTTQEIDPDGQDPALARGPDGRVHLVHTSATGVWHSDDASGWTPEIIDPSAAHRSSIAISAEGTVHVAYTRDLGGGADLYYAVQAPEGWTTAPVPPGASWTSPGVSIALTADGQPQIAFELRMIDRSYRVRLAEWTEEGWIYERIADFERAGAAPAVAVAGDGSAHLVFSDNVRYELWHAFPDAGDWAMELVDSDAGNGPKMFVTTSDGFVVAYGSGEVAAATDGVWHLDLGPPRAELLWAPALVVGPDGQWHMSFVFDDYVFDGSVRRLTYAVRTADEQWTMESFETGWVDTTAIVLDLEGRPLVAFGKDGAVLIARRHGVPDGVDQDCDGDDG